MELVPLLVTIKRGLVGNKMQNIYPDFKQVPDAIRKGLDWSYYVDAHGIGVHYDKVEGFGEGGDPTVQMCMICVPADFAAEAVKLFPDTVKKMTAAACESFYNDKAHAHEPEFQNDSAELTALAAKKTLGIAECPDDKCALDPDHPRVGIRRNKNKTWKQFCVKRTVTLKGA